MHVCVCECAYMYVMACKYYNHYVGVLKSAIMQDVYSNLQRILGI